MIQLNKNKKIIDFGRPVGRLKPQFPLVIHGKLHQNKLHGLTRIFGSISTETNTSCNSFLLPTLSFVGRFRNGVPHGYCWKGLIGGAWLYGLVDEKGQFTGNEIAYIYPDLQTVLLGTFKKGRMVYMYYIYIYIYIYI